MSPTVSQTVNWNSLTFTFTFTYYLLNLIHCLHSVLLQGRRTMVKPDCPLELFQTEVWTSRISKTQTFAKMLLSFIASLNLSNTNSAGFNGLSVLLLLFTMSFSIVALTIPTMRNICSLCWWHMWDFFCKIYLYGNCICKNMFGIFFQLFLHSVQMHCKNMYFIKGTKSCTDSSLKCKYTYSVYIFSTEQ